MRQPEIWAKPFSRTSHRPAVRRARMLSGVARGRGDHSGMDSSGHVFLNNERVHNVTILDRLFAGWISAVADGLRGNGCLADDPARRPSSWIVGRGETARENRGANPGWPCGLIAIQAAGRWRRRSARAYIQNTKRVETAPPERHPPEITHLRLLSKRECNGGRHASSATSRYLLFRKRLLSNKCVRSSI